MHLTAVPRFFFQITIQIKIECSAYFKKKNCREFATFRNEMLPDISRETEQINFRKISETLLDGL